MANPIYADHAATTPLSAQALEAMMPYLTAVYANPSALYASGRAARRAVETARAQIAAALGALPQEIYFTAGGTEADNWAIRGAAARAGSGHIISTAIEHTAVLETLERLRAEGFAVTLLPVDAYGRAEPEAVRAALRPDTCLISVMAANNEIGTVQPIAAISQIAAAAGVVFHTDAVQAVGQLPIDLTHVDLLTLSGHKCGGPKGIGVLYIRKNLQLPRLIHGGGQEGGRRAGTEHVAGIVGLAAALDAAVREREAETKRLTTLRNRLIEGVLAIPGARLTGDPVNRLPGLASFVFDGVEGEDLLLLLDRQGICASSGSACASGAMEPSHVLLALGLSHKEARGSLRLSLGKTNTDADVDAILQHLQSIVPQLRGSA